MFRQIKFMNLLNKNLLITFVFLVSLSFVKAQSFSERIIFGDGLSILTDIFMGPEALSKNNSSVYTNYGISILSYSLNPRFILKEFSNNTSISLDIPVSLAISFSDNGFGSFTVPVMLGFNHGNISGYSSDKEKGFVLGLGVQYLNSAIIKSEDFYEDEVKRSWIEPVFNIGYRYWNKKFVAKEINLKVGYKPGETFMDDKNYEKGSTRSFSMRLAFIVYPKY